MGLNHQNLRKILLNLANRLHHTLFSQALLQKYLISYTFATKRPVCNQEFGGSITLYIIDLQHRTKG